MTTKQFNCCDLTEAAKVYQTTCKWKERDIFLGLEFLNKSFIFKNACEECKEWFAEQEEKQDEILNK